jgi:hypothetical protein
MLEGLLIIKCSLTQLNRVSRHSNVHVSIRIYHNQVSTHASFYGFFVEKLLIPIYIINKCHLQLLKCISLIGHKLQPNYSVGHQLYIKVNLRRTTLGLVKVSIFWDNIYKRWFWHYFLENNFIFCQRVAILIPSH